MTRATVFDSVMRAIWGDLDYAEDFIIKSIADKVRGTARINPENAFEVLEMFGPDYVTWMDSRVPDGEESRDVTVHTIRFDDGSSIIIEAKRGFGVGVEVI